LAAGFLVVAGESVLEASGLVTSGTELAEAGTPGSEVVEMV